MFNVEVSVDSDHHLTAEEITSQGLSVVSTSEQPLSTESDIVEEYMSTANDGEEQLSAVAEPLVGEAVEVSASASEAYNDLLSRPC